VYDIGAFPLTPMPVIDPVLEPQTLVFVVGVAVSEGTGLTVIWIEDEFTQLFASVPETE
jgi:hypothetical protein